MNKIVQIQNFQCVFEFHEVATVTVNWKVRDKDAGDRDAQYIRKGLHLS